MTNTENRIPIRDAASRGSAVQRRRVSGLLSGLVMAFVLVGGAGFRNGYANEAPKAHSRMRRLYSWAVKHPSRWIARAKGHLSERKQRAGLRTAISHLNSQLLHLRRARTRAERAGSFDGEHGPIATATDRGRADDIKDAPIELPQGIEGLALFASTGGLTVTRQVQEEQRTPFTPLGKTIPILSRVLARKSTITREVSTRGSRGVARELTAGRTPEEIASLTEAVEAATARVTDEGARYGEQFSAQSPTLAERYLTVKSKLGNVARKAGEATRSAWNKTRSSFRREGSRSQTNAASAASAEPAPAQ